LGNRVRPGSRKKKKVVLGTPVRRASPDDSGGKKFFGGMGRWGIGVKVPGECEEESKGGTKGGGTRGGGGIEGVWENMTEEVY